MAWFLYDVRRDFWPVDGGAFEEGALSFFQIPCGIRCATLLISHKARNEWGTIGSLPPGGKPREIVTPRVVQVIIQEDRREQAELEGPAGLKLLDDLPGRRDFVCGYWGGRG